MSHQIRIFAIIVFSLQFSISLSAQEIESEHPSVQPEDVFARQGSAVITHAELDAEFSKIPPEYRLEYIRSGERVNQIIGTLLRYKLVSGDAMAAGFEKEPVVEARMALAAEKELAEAWVLQVMEDAPDADYEALAHEFYLAHPDGFMTPEFVDVTHILIGSEERSRDEALEIALSLREQLLADPTLFGAFVEEYSEDPSKRVNKGNFPTMQRGEMVKPFEDAAFALQTEGEISEPVETSYGYHLIMFNKRYSPRVKKYEDVKADAMTAARKSYLEEYRSRYIRKLLENPIELQDGAVEAMARKYFGQNLELAPDYQE